VEDQAHVAAYRAGYQAALAAKVRTIRARGMDDRRGRALTLDAPKRFVGVRFGLLWKCPLTWDDAGV
jgi:hypothetical protein